MKKITLLFALLLATISKAQIVDVYPFWVWDGSQNKTITLQVSALDINSNLQQKNIAWIDTSNFKLDALNNVQSSVNTNSVILGVDNNGNVDRLDVSSLPFKSSSYTPTLSINGNSLTAGGNTVTIPSGNDSQTLSISSNTISISNGNSITLPTYSLVAGSGITLTQSGNTYTVSLTDPTFNNGVSRSLNSNYTISSTKNVRCSYLINVTWSVLLNTFSGLSYLEYSTNSGSSWITVNQCGRTQNSNLTSNGSDDLNLSGEVPRGALVRIRTSATNCTITYNSGQEVTY